jgi:hypothetical protein
MTIKRMFRWRKGYNSVMKDGTEMGYYLISFVIVLNTL